MSTAIFDVTHSCLEYFDRAVAKHDSALLTHLIQNDDVDPRKALPCDFLGIRNSFLFWIDYTGALSLVDSSLDARLQGLADISAVVMELLDMVLRSLRRLDTVPEKTTPYIPSETDPDVQVPSSYLSRWENACQAIQSGLDELHFVALAIRKASAKRLDQMVTTSVTPEDVVFRRNVTTLVRYRFPAARKALCQQLGDSIADRRQMILQSKRHAKKLAVRREPTPSAPVQPPKATPSASGPAIDPKIVARIAPRPSEVISGMTKASRPDPKVLELRQIQAPRPKALSTVISTVSTSQEHSFDYPELPQAKEGEVRVQCPFCLVPLDLSGSEKKRQDSWKRHVDEHTKPYACLYPQCAKAVTFFTRRREWKAHMETSHSKDWLRKVHTMVWFCDIDHEEPLTFDTESEWREHMRDLYSHPNRNLKAPTQLQLDALAPRKQQAAPRDAFVCPLCEQVPQKLQPLLEGGRNDQFELQSQVVDHVADHLKSLSLMVLPSLQDADGAPELSADSVKRMGEDSGRELNDGSVAQPPSGIHLIDEASLPPENWGDMTFDELNKDGLLDKDAPVWDPEWEPEFAEVHLRSQDPSTPEACDTVWSGPWLSSSETGNGPIWSTDPILSSFMAIWRDTSGRTQLHDAAEKGDVSIVQQLLEFGADIDAQNHDRQTPLILAAAEGHLETVSTLINARANIDAESQYHESPLLRAAQNGHAEVVALLVNSGANVEARGYGGQTALVKSASKGHSDIVDYLLRAGVDVNWGRNPTPGDPRDYTSALSAAVMAGNLITVQLLISHGADLKTADNQGMSALGWAVHRWHVNIAVSLLRSGADAQHRDDQGRNMFVLAIDLDEINREEIDILGFLNELLVAGVDVNGVSDDGTTALLAAIRHHHWLVVEWLLGKGADILFINSNGHGVLSTAVLQSDISIVQLQRLVDAGAELQPADPGAISPLVEAARHQSPNVLRFLLDLGADINRCDGGRDGFTPLMAAGHTGSVDNVNLLLERGADVNRTSLNGNTALSATLHFIQFAETEIYEATKKAAMRLVAAGVEVNKLRQFRNPLDVAAERFQPSFDLGPGTEVSSELREPRLTTSTCGRCGELAGCEVDHSNPCQIHAEPLWSAAAAGDPVLVRLLLDHGADVNAWSRDREGRMTTALIEAAVSGSVETVHLLLDAGADANAQDPVGAQGRPGPGETALMSALMSSEHNPNLIVQALLKAGANPNGMRCRGRTALLMAIEWLNAPVALALLEAGADVEAVLDHTGTTPLMSAVSKGMTQLILPLLHAGADPRIWDTSDQSAWIIAKGREDMTEWAQVLEVWSRAAHISEKQQNAQTRLWNSVEMGYAHVLDQALDDGADILAADETEETVLHLAVSKTPKERVRMIVQKLIDRGASHTATNASNMTPVMLAIAMVEKYLHAYALQALLAAGVDVGRHLTLMQTAVIHENSDAVKRLLDEGADPNESTTTAKFGPLWLAVCLDNYGLVEMLLQAGADPNAETQPFTSISTASWHSSFEIVAALINAGANADLAVTKSAKALEVFSGRGDASWVRVLLQQGTQPSQRGLIAAVRRGYAEVVELLLEAGVDVREADEEGWTPLHHAAIKGFPIVIRILLRAGADLNARGCVVSADSESNSADFTDNKGNMPVHVSAWEGWRDATACLLQAGADPDSRGVGDRTPLHYAAMGGHVEVARLLVESGCDLNTWDSSQTAVLTAMAYNHPDMVRFLLAEGADIGDYSQYSSLLNWAATNGHVDIVAFIRLAVDAYGRPGPIQRGAITWLAERGYEQALRIMRDDDSSDDCTAVIEDPGLRARLMALRSPDSSLPALVVRSPTPVLVVQPPSPTILGTDELENSQSDAQASQLVYAVEQNYVERLTTLLDQHFDVNASTTEGLTALHQAVISQRQDLVPLLARAGANLNQYDTMGATPLLKCAESDHVEVAQRLLEAGADPNMQGDDFWRNETPLSACVRCKNVTLASILLKSGARLSGNAPPLREAVGKSDAELLRFLLAAGADFKEDGEHVLNWAAEANFADIAAFLCVIDDSNMFDRGKASQIALDNGWRRLGRHIRDRGFADASLSVIQHRGLRAKLMEMGKISKLDPDHTPEDLIEAVRNNDRLTVEMLLERGVNTNSDDAEAALELAISLDRSELIEILAAVDAGSNQPAHLALRIAAQDGDAKLVRALLDAGADPDCRRTKPTPLSLALSGNKLEVIELLLNAGADPNGCGQSLHDASRNNWLEAVKLLINAGVNVNKVQQGSSLVDVAARRDHLEMVRLLLGAGANVISHSLNVWAIKQGHDDIIKFIQLIGNLEESYVDMYVDPRMITQQEAMMARGVLGQGGDDEDTLIADQGMRRQLIKLGKLSGSGANVGDRGQEVSGQSQEDDDDDKTIAH